jgi:hypothetical protein
MLRQKPYSSVVTTWVARSMAAWTDLQVFMAARHARNEAPPAPRVHVDEQPAMPEHLHRQDRRRLTEIDDVDIAAEEACEVLAQLHQLRRGWPFAEQRGEVDVRTGRREGCRTE